MENTGLHHEIGRHDAKIEALQADMAAVKNDVHEIKLILAEAKGGWRTLLVVGGVAATVGAAASKILTWLGFIPK